MRRNLFGYSVQDDKDIFMAKNPLYLVDLSRKSLGANDHRILGV